MIVLKEPEMLAAVFFPEGPTASISPLNFLTSPLALLVWASKLTTTLLLSAIAGGGDYTRA